MKKINPKKILANGGQIGSAIAPTLGTVANAVAPGTGALIEPLWQMMSSMLDSRSNKLTLSPGKTTFGHGGSLQSAGSTGVSYYNGKSHTVGGIRVTPNGTPTKLMTGQEVEGGETLVDFKDLGTHIFSKRLKVK